MLRKYNEPGYCYILYYHKLRMHEVLFSTADRRFVSSRGILLNFEVITRPPKDKLFTQVCSIKDSLQSLKSRP